MSSHLYRDTGVVLRTYRLGEADRIVVLLTEHHGKVRAVAKGVRKTKSRFGARLEPASHVRLLLAQGRDLDIVSQAEAVESLAPLVVDLDHLTSAIAVLEAVDQMTLDREPAPHLYKMLVGVLAHDRRTRAGPLVVPAFFWKLLAVDGVRPELDACVRCGEPETARRLRPRRGRRAVPSVPQWHVDQPGRAGPDAPGARRPAERGAGLDPSPATHEVSTLATKAFEHHIERRLRTVAMFER